MKKLQYFKKAAVVSMIIAQGLVIALPAFSQPLLPGSPTVGGRPGTTQLLRVIDNVINWALGLLIFLAVAVIIYAAFNYLTAGGNAEQVKNANKYLVYVAIAVAVALLSKAFVAIVIELVSTTPAGVNITGGNQGGVDIRVSIPF